MLQNVSKITTLLCQLTAECFINPIDQGVRISLLCYLKTASRANSAFTS